MIHLQSKTLGLYSSNGCPVARYLGGLTGLPIGTDRSIELAFPAI